MAENIINRPTVLLDGKEATVLGAQQIIVGVENPDKREVRTD
jgi:hypothetical protein